MTTTLTAKPVSEAAKFLRNLSPSAPACAFVLGSGVKVLEDLDDSKSVSFEQVFGIAPGVVGHAGSLSLGKVEGKLVAVLRGRFHLYEGHNWDVVSLAARTLIEWGVPALYLTNAAGGLNQNFQVGDLMLLTGYRDLLNPKWADTGLLPALKADATDCRNALTERLLQTSEQLQKKDKSFRALRTGVYAGLLGPNYETLAEIDMLKRLKADAVGMSTVPELEAVKGTKTQAAAISVITNVWSPDELIGGHEEVLQAAKEASERLDKLFRAAIATF
jgi:purine-nucleoside phosphorylase